MRTINYITNLDVNEYSGGWSGMNHNIYLQLRRYYHVNLLNSINPPYSFITKLKSKVSRLLGAEGIFGAFTKNRLNQVAEIVHARLDPDAGMNFFHGATPWLNVSMKKPYALYLDACFETYINIYHKGSKFDTLQLRNLYAKEAEFLTNAAAVFFSSHWALNDAKRLYNINSDNFFVAGLGGGLDSSKEMSNGRKPYILFIGLDFIGKGGGILVNTFKEIHKRFPDVTLKIVGERPPAVYLKNVGVEYIGIIDKVTTQGQKQLTDLLEHAYCLVLPTSKDITPLVLVEAGSVGCPVISVNNFGIPEVVISEETGILIEEGELIKEQLEGAITRLIEHPTVRHKFSKNAKDHIHANFSWAKTGEKIYNTLSGVPVS